MGTGPRVLSSFRTELADSIGGGARRDRTADLLHAMQALSQLSYGPTQGRRNLRTASGLVKLGLSSVSVRRNLAEQHQPPARPHGTGARPAKSHPARRPWLRPP